DYAPAVYWPQDANANVYFYAYSPAGSVNVDGFGSKLSANASDSATVKYTVPLTATGGKQPEDFLVAKKAQSKQLGGTTVSLDFQHALSMVKFAARNKHPEATYIVKKIELFNLANEGDLDLGLLAEKDSRDSTYWDVTGSYNLTYQPALPADGIGLAPGSSSFKQLTSANEGMPVLPQTVLSVDTSGGHLPDITSGKPALRVTFEATGANGQVLIPETQQLFPFPATHNTLAAGGGKATWPGTSGEFVFQMGKRYTFNFTFGAGAIDRIVFDVNSVADWEDVPLTRAGIWNAADLRAFKDSVEKGSWEIWKDAQGVVNLRADIDMQGQTLSAIGYYAELPNGDPDLSHIFTNAFNGNGYAIRNAVFTENSQMANSADPDYSLGLFSMVNQASIENLHLENAILELSAAISNYDPKYVSTSAGGIVAFAVESRIRNCSFSGRIPDQNNQIWSSGGLIGSGIGVMVENCWVEASLIRGHGHAGGLIGQLGNIQAATNQPEEVKACSVYNTSVEARTFLSPSGDAATAHVGALVGIVGCEAKLIACYAATDKSASPAYGLKGEIVGGLVGFLDTGITLRLTGCYNAIPMTRLSPQSGFIGTLVGKYDNVVSTTPPTSIPADIQASGCYGVSMGQSNPLALGNEDGQDCTLTLNPLFSGGPNASAFDHDGTTYGFYGSYFGPNNNQSVLEVMNAALQAAGAGYEYVDPSGNGSAYPVLRKP
ncbi:MAG: fimbrillin family protein, partial [Tannerella sp.]|nr:fimbrillin family protein [Tannerella sp.]